MANSTRIRDNQRRSRARRKEYIQNLEGRLQKFEKLGVQATLEVQLAGRQVAEENVLLRSLLRLQGVTDEKVEDFLRSHRGLNDSPGLTMRSSHSTPNLLQTISPDSASNANAEKRVFEPTHSYSKVANPSSQGELDFQSAGRSEVSPSSTYALHTAPPSACNSGFAVTTTTEEPCCEGQVMDDDLETGQVTSCETAARIITMMRGYPDTQEARAELGCPSEKSCVVKNMTIFELLDR